MLNHLMVQTEMAGADLVTIGGHFSLMTTEYENSQPGRYGFESARSGLYTLMRAIKPKRVFIPNYICSAVPDILLKAGCGVESYPISEGFIGAEKLNIREGDLVILVNYYGISEQAIRSQLAKLPPHAVIVDNSQAYFQAPFACLANLYSPRKFVPVPDGGYVATEVALELDEADEDASMQRFRYLLERVGRPPEPSRQSYLTAESSLETPSSRRMSMLSEGVLKASDLGAIVARRRANFGALEDLSCINKLKLSIGDQVPLVYPLMLDDGQRIYKKLIEKRIFCPRFWPFVAPGNDFERRLLEDTVFLPIDHRYGVDTMIGVSDYVKFARGI